MCGLEIWTVYHVEAEGVTVSGKLVKIFLLIGGLISIGVGLFWAIFFSLQGGIAENVGDVAVLIVAGTASLVIGLRESAKP